MLLIIMAIVAAGIGGLLLVHGWRRHRIEPTFAFLEGVFGILIAATAIYAALVSPTQSQAFTAPTLLITLLAATMAIAASLALWRRHSHLDRPHDINRSNLAIALGGGAAVAILLAWVQLFLTSLSTQQQETQEAAQREASDRERTLTLYEDFRFRISLARDLTGFSPPVDPRSSDDRPLDMSDMGLRGKTLQLANLEDVNLSGADLTMADLSGSLMSRARLQEGRTGPANLRAATFRGAILHGTQLQAANLTEADLGQAYVHGASFRGAKLDWADLRGLRCGEDTDQPRECSEDDLLALGLPSYADRPPTACWPTDEAVGQRQDCGKYARLIRQSPGV